MQELYERFYVFISSSFSRKEKIKLFEFIWNHYHKKIVFYISNLIPFDHFAFDDIFQEVMVKIYKNLHTFNPLHSFKAWIYTIARNHCLDFLKNRRENFYSPAEFEIEKVLDTRTPETILIQKELYEKIEKFMDSLESIDREIAYLRFFEILRYSDMSRILNMNVNTLKSRVCLIKKRIKENLNS